MPEEKKEEKKEDDKIILQVDMHCEGCKAKVRKALKEFKGVEGLDVNMQDQRVTIKGKLDAKKVYETVKKKSGKRTVLIFPDPKKLAEDAEKAKKEEPKKEEPPPPPDPEVVVVLKVNMHCGACAKQIRKSLLKVDGVTDVKEDFAKSTVTVMGKGIDPDKLCARVKKRSGKHCEVVPPPPPPPPKEEEKKEEAKPAEEKKEEEKKEEAKPAEDAKNEEKPAEAAPAAAEPEKKEEEKKEEEKTDGAAPEEKKEEKAEEKKDAPAEEEKKEEKAEEKKEEEKKEAEGAEETKTEVKKYEYIPYRSVPEYYVYPPQLFSDENPNACSIM